MYTQDQMVLSSNHFVISFSNDACADLSEWQVGQREIIEADRDIRNPATLELIEQVPDCGQKDVNAAVRYLGSAGIAPSNGSPVSGRTAITVSRIFDHVALNFL